LANVKPLEVAFWLCTLLPFVLAPNYLSLASQIAITALFALSLDLILGYAGIVSLGHAAFFGMGAYTAGLIAKHYWTEPISALLISGLISGILGYASSHVIVRFRHLALIMLTMGFGLLLACRPWEFSVVNALKKRPPESAHGMGARAQALGQRSNRA